MKRGMQISVGRLREIPFLIINLSACTQHPARRCGGGVLLAELLCDEGFMD
jgi:hypothetical protein